MFSGQWTWIEETMARTLDELEAELSRALQQLGALERKEDPSPAAIKALGERIEKLETVIADLKAKVSDGTKDEADGFGFF
jgi:CII-binding regulator of phage lambda lysogenization HflD